MCWISISRTSAAVTFGLIVSCACLRKLPRALRNLRLSVSARSIMSRSALSTAGRSALNCSTALRKSAISVALVAEEQLQQLLQLRRVVDPAAHHFLLVLDQHRFVRVLEDDVVLRIALAEFLFDLVVEVVVLVLRLPIAERHAQRVKQRAVRRRRRSFGQGLDIRIRG